MLHLGIIGLALSLLAPSPAAAAGTADVPTGRVAVRIVTVNGAGCPASSVSTGMSPDNTGFRIWFSAFVAQLGRGAKATDLRKNCQLQMEVDAPAGYTYAISRIGHIGYAYLVRGVTATSRTNHSFQGNTPPAYETHTIAGPLDDLWSAVSEYGPDALDWAPCDERRPLNLTFELRLTADPAVPEATAQLSFVSKDYLDIVGGDPYTLAWRRC